MFEVRVKVLLFLLLFALAIIVARLVDMQVAHAEVYRRQAEEALLLPVKTVDAVRGRILDRMGVELAADEPCWDVKVDYGILAMDSGYIASRVNRLRRQGAYGAGLSSDEVETRFLQAVERMWSDFSRFSGTPARELKSRGNEICERISAIRAAVSAHRGFDTPVREERMRHAILAGLDDQEQVAARELFSPYPWVGVEDSTRRAYRAGESMAHVLGRLGPVTAAHLEDDPFDDDPLRKYLGNETLGVTGVERLGEGLLRGRRGRYQENRAGEVVENVAAMSGRDLHLTLRRDLQDRLYDMFEHRLAEVPYSPGGSIIVLDVRARECLAMVSYPAYDPNEFQEKYSVWRLDTRGQPLRFRAVANHYPPGSIVKPLACLAGLNTGRIGLDTQFTCEGALFPSQPDRWRCWMSQSGQRMHHGPVNATEAIKHSCNIFMYKTGERVGVETLCSYFEMVGFGREYGAGTGLAEEVRGINPTPDWLASHKDMAVTPGTARLFAIGQAEVSVTPLQAANLMAVYASRTYRPVTLVKELSHPVEWSLPGEEAHWRAIRRGMYGVVNDFDGTAHRTAWLDPSCGYVICGKTGSAQDRPWPVSYAIPYVDTNGHEGIAIQNATTRSEAEADFIREHPEWAFDRREVRIHERWPSVPPPEGRTHSHAWFAGFLQAVDASGEPQWDRTPPIAFAVMVEFGGSGGQVSAPIGRAVAEIVIDVLGPDLDPDAPLRTGPPALDADAALTERPR